MIRDGSSVVKSYCPKYTYFWGDFLVEGVKDSICVFYLDLGPKMTSTIWCWDEKFCCGETPLLNVTTANKWHAATSFVTAFCG